VAGHPTRDRGRAICSVSEAYESLVQLPAVHDRLFSRKGGRLKTRSRVFVQNPVTRDDGSG
jgi:hypothetical protein